MIFGTNLCCFFFLLLSNNRYIIVTCGLPATGKTYIARRICQYLRFFHGSTIKVFNVGNYRRKMFGAKSPSEFFDPANKQSVVDREKCAHAAMKDLREWVSVDDPNGRVAIYDATNTTRKRRDWITKQLSSVIENSRKIIFLESVVTDNNLVTANILEAKVTMPDYEGKNEQEAIEDFQRRIAHYRSVYEPLDVDLDKDLSWIKVIDGGRHTSLNHISGFIPGRIANFTMNLHTNLRPIYLSRHGQSMYNKLQKIGGDSALSESGETYAKNLAAFVHTDILKLNADGSFKDPANKTTVHARLFTSSLQRTKMTARHITHQKCDDGWIIMRPRVCPALDEIYAGVFDGMTYDEIKERAPEEFEKRKEDKLTYRYPRGESYLDVIARLDPIVHEVERMREPVLIVGHQGILRILYSYFTGGSREEAPFQSIPLNHVIKLEPHTYRCEVERFNLNKGETLHEAPSH